MAQNRPTNKAFVGVLLVILAFGGLIGIIGSIQQFAVTHSSGSVKVQATVGSCSSSATSGRTCPARFTDSGTSYTIDVADEKPGAQLTIYVKKSALPAGGGPVHGGAGVSSVHTYAVYWYIGTLVILLVLAVRIAASVAVARTQRLVRARS